MVYSNRRIMEYLATGVLEGYEFRIVNYGTHPYAYVRLPKSHKYYGGNYCGMDIKCHGGLAYGQSEGDDYWIGWHYAHCGDYFGLLPFPSDKKWTTNEILTDVYAVIKQLKAVQDGKI